MIIKIALHEEHGLYTCLLRNIFCPSVTSYVLSPRYPLAVAERFIVIRTTFILLDSEAREFEPGIDLEYPQTPVIITCEVWNAVCFKLQYISHKPRKYIKCFYSQTGFRQNYRRCKRHGSYTAWERHVMCELAADMLRVGNVMPLCVLKELSLCHIRQMTRRLPVFAFLTRACACVFIIIRVSSYDFAFWYLLNTLHAVFR